MAKDAFITPDGIPIKDYAMSIIASRILPDVRDGLIPVQRRLLYAMDSMGLSANGKFVGSELIVNETKGKYHPHNDIFKDKPMVSMAQDFSTRYPLIQGNGNFGSVNRDPPASLRYTEAKLSEIGGEMLKDLQNDAVDFVPTYDGKSQEPTVLPSAVPNLLINGFTGTAAGMVSSMAPHNLTEICNAICAYIDNPDISIEELMEYVQGPDFPTGGEIICHKETMLEVYKTGRGSFTLWGKYSIEIAKSGKKTIVFTEIPFNVDYNLLLQEINRLIQDKVIDGIASVNNESDYNETRLVINLKKRALVNVVLKQLFENTQLQTTFEISNMAMVNGKPQCLNLKDLIRHFIEYRVDVVTRLAHFYLRFFEEREQNLKELISLTNNEDCIKSFADDFIKILNDEEITDKPPFWPLSRQLGLMSKLNLQLIDFNIEKLQEDLEELKESIDYCNNLLVDKSKLLEEIKKDTKAIAEKYGDTRRTKIDILHESIPIDWDVRIKAGLCHHVAIVAKDLEEPE